MRSCQVSREECRRAGSRCTAVLIGQMAEKSWFTSRPQPSPLLHCVDRRGLSIRPDVLRIARSIVARAIPFAEQLINDAELATSLLEESAASVSRVVRMRSEVGKAPIVHLEAYLFRAFIRRVNLARSREVLVATASSGALSRDGAGCSEPLELKVLQDEFITQHRFFRIASRKKRSRIHVHGDEGPSGLQWEPTIVEDLDHRECQE